MATQVVMPKLSPTMEEGQLARWLKQEGDKVSVGEPLAEIDTDKATMEAQALTTGVLRKILVPAGETVPLGAIIAIIGDADEDISALVGQAASPSASAERKKDIEESVKAGGDGAQTELAQVVPEGERTQATIEGQPLKGDVGGPTSSEEKPAVEAKGGETDNGQRGQTGGRLLVSPIAARMAAEAGLNLKSLSGSGPGGRIIKRDIEAALSSGAQQSQPATAQQPEQPQPALAQQTQAPARPVVTQTADGAPAFR